MSDFSDLFLYNDKTRGPIVDGIFYPDDDLQLNEEIKELLAEIKTEPGHSFGIIAPHAALPYSGSLSAAAFKSAAARSPDNVIIISPVHRDYKDYAYLTESESFSIPSGILKVNNEINLKLLEYSPFFIKDDMPHLEEHSIEIQLPFIKYLFPGAKIVPILIGSGSLPLLKTVANGLKYAFRGYYEKNLFVISANFTNYLPSIEAKKYCTYLLDIILKKDMKSLAAEIEKNDKKSNGIGCISIMMDIAGDDAEMKLLGNRDSAENCSDCENIVCYASVSVNSEIK